VKDGKTGQNSEEREKIGGASQEVCGQSQSNAFHCTALEAVHQKVRIASIASNCIKYEILHQIHK
jgi:hypothetical protein